MLRIRQLIPPLTARTSAGKTTRAWDFKQKRNLVIAFLAAASPHSENFLQQLAEHAADLRERNALALVVFAQSDQGTLPPMPGEIVIGVEISGRSARAYMGEDAFGPAGQQRSGIFVADRFGELYAQWVVPANQALPQIGEIIGWLDQIELTCEECGVYPWIAAE